MIYINILSIFSTSKTRNRLNQFLKLIRGDNYTRDFLIFSSNIIKYECFCLLKSKIEVRFSIRELNT